MTEELTIDRNAAHAILKSVSGGIARKEILDQSTSFVFKDGQVFTYNDELAVRADFPFGDFVGAIPAEALLAFLDRAPKEQVKVQPKGEEVLFRAGRCRVGLALEQEITLPIDEVELPEKWVKLPVDFFDALRFCSFSLAKDVNRPALTCFYCHRGQVITSDGFRLTRFQLKGGKGFRKAMLLPSFAQSHIVALDATHYNATGDWLHFRNEEGAVLSCRTYQADFPKIDHLLEVEGDAVKLPQSLIEALDRAAIFTEPDPTVALEFVTVKLSPGKVRVEAKSVAGWIKEEAKARYSGEPVEFKINPGFFKETLAIMNEMQIAENAIRLDAEAVTHVAHIQ